MRKRDTFKDQGLLFPEEKPKPKPSTPRERYAKRKFPGTTFYGMTIPPLLGPDNQPYRCDCGRIQMMRGPNGVFLFDREGELGKSSYGLWKGDLHKAITYFKKMRCRLHPPIAPPTALPES